MDRATKDGSDLEIPRLKEGKGESTTSTSGGEKPTTSTVDSENELPVKGSPAEAVTGRGPLEVDVEIVTREERRGGAEEEDDRPGLVEEASEQLPEDELRTGAGVVAKAARLFAAALGGGSEEEEAAAGARPVLSTPVWEQNSLQREEDNRRRQSSTLRCQRPKIMAREVRSGRGRSPNRYPCRRKSSRRATCALGGKGERSRRRRSADRVVRGDRVLLVVEEEEDEVARMARSRSTSD